jgi:hypothetical protein
MPKRYSAWYDIESWTTADIIVGGTVAIIIILGIFHLIGAI